MIGHFMRLSAILLAANAAEHGTLPRPVCLEKTEAPINLVVTTGRSLVRAVPMSDCHLAGC